MTMNSNFIEINNHRAVVSYVPEYKMFRGKFLNTTGYCDFMSDTVSGLYNEGEVSLNMYLKDCEELGIKPFKEDKQKTFTLRYGEDLSNRVSQYAKERGISINNFIISAIENTLNQQTMMNHR